MPDINATLTAIGRLYAVQHCADGRVIDHGLIAERCITTAFVNYLVDSLQATEADWVNFKYHDCGTGTNVEAVGDTALQTPYGGARAVGTQTEGATANVYKSIATIAFTLTQSIVEHGLFNAAAAGTLMDRSKFTAIPVVNADSIIFTFTMTFTAGG